MLRSKHLFDVTNPDNHTQISYHHCDKWSVQCFGADSKLLFDIDIDYFEMELLETLLPIRSDTCSKPA